MSANELRLAFSFIWECFASSVMVAVEDGKGLAFRTALR